MSDLPRVKVINPGGGRLGTEVYINDNKIEHVTAVDFRMSVDEVPTFTFETNGLPEINMPGNGWLSFTPQTIEEAKKIIEHEMKNKHRVDLQLQKGCVKAYVDGEYIPACEKIEPDNKECDEHIRKIEFIPNEKALFSQYVQADLSHYTRFAMIVLRNELLKHGDLYNGFLASVKSAIKEFPENQEMWADEAAKVILNRIIGDEKHAFRAQENDMGR